MNNSNTHEITYNKFHHSSTAAINSKETSKNDTLTSLVVHQGKGNKQEEEERNTFEPEASGLEREKQQPPKVKNDELMPDALSILKQLKQRRDELRSVDRQLFRAMTQYLAQLDLPINRQDWPEGSSEIVNQILCEIHQTGCEQHNLYQNHHLIEARAIWPDHNNNNNEANGHLYFEQQANVYGQAHNVVPSSGEGEIMDLSINKSNRVIDSFAQQHDYGAYKNHINFPASTSTTSTSDIPFSMDTTTESRDLRSGAAFAPQIHRLTSVICGHDHSAKRESPISSVNHKKSRLLGAKLPESLRTDNRLFNEQSQCYQALGLANSQLPATSRRPSSSHSLVSPISHLNHESLHHFDDDIDTDGVVNSATLIDSRETKSADLVCKTMDEVHVQHEYPQQVHTQIQQRHQYHQHFNSHRAAFRCHVCSSGFEDRHRLQQHLSIHLNLNPDWYEERTIKETMAHYESRRGDYMCQSCSIRFETTADFDRHMHLHAEKPHRCDLCSLDNKLVSFRYYRQLLTHLRSHCFLYSCRFVSDCKQTANRKDYLKLHILKHHLNNKLPEQYTVCCHLPKINTTTTIQPQQLIEQNSTKQWTSLHNSDPLVVIKTPPI